MSILSVIDTIRPPSLLPYLQSGPGKFHLMVGMDPDIASSPLKSCDSPFQLQDVPNPFALLGNARIVSDVGQEVLPLFMLIQRSDYQYSPEENRLDTNPSIDREWQQILSVLLTPPVSDLYVPLAEQRSKEGRLLQFQSLFYCKAKLTFFHPPCPDCGKELTVCTDDILLARYDLDGYSTSLRRFLYCPKCCSDQTAASYYVLKRAEKDPDCVEDIRQLMRKWAHLQSTVTADTSLPCHGCPGNKACFGQNAPGLDLLCCFSFYPFYMVLLKSEPEICFDFQALLSGKAKAHECIIKTNRPSVPTCSSGPPQDNASAQEIAENISPSMSTKSADAAIRGILADISQKWESADGIAAQPQAVGKPVQPSPTPAILQRDDADLMETVILSSTPLSHKETPLSDNKFGETGTAHPGMNRVPSPTSSFRPADTLHIQPLKPELEKLNQETFTSPLAEHPSVHLEETIIITPQSGKEIRGHVKPSPSPADTTVKIEDTRHNPLFNGGAKDHDLAETIIQRPEKKP